MTVSLKRRALLPLAAILFASTICAQEATQSSSAPTPGPASPPALAEDSSASIALKAPDRGKLLEGERTPAPPPAPGVAQPNLATPSYSPPYGPAELTPPEPEPIGQWLDEVRRQRQAWEARRHAAREAIDARRRWIDPWGAAQQDAIEQEVQRRRDAFREKIERDREAFRSLRPWPDRPSPWGGEPTAPGEHPGQSIGEGEPPPDPGAPYPPLPGWDNRWYYRGF